MLGPTRRDQWDTILAGVRKAKVAGKRLVFCITNEPGLPQAIKQVMPRAKIFYRAVYGAHDQSPEERGWPHGAQWVRELWDRSYWSVQGVDVWIFSNEWWGNKRDVAFIQRFTTFWKQVIDECVRRGIVCTVGDWSVGTPGWPEKDDEAHQLPALQPLLDYVEATGMWANMHLYHLRDAETGALLPLEYTWQRYRILRRNHPGLKIVAGEMGDINDGGGMFTDQSLQHIKDMYAAVKDDGVIGGWWLYCDPERQRNPEADWSKDNIEPIYPPYIDWVIS